MCTVHHSVGDYGILLSYFSRKNSVKATFFLMKLLNSWFDEIIFQCEYVHFLVFPHYCAAAAQFGNSGNLLSRIFNKNFVKVTFSTIKSTELIWRNNFWWEANFSFSHTVLSCLHSVEITEILSHARIFNKNFVKVTGLPNKLLKT